MTPTTGQFIVLDGPDGCGKSTQTRLLAQWLAGRGCEVAGNPEGVSSDLAVGVSLRLRGFPLLLSPKGATEKIYAFAPLGLRMEYNLYGYRRLTPPANLL
jgi:energy-coupling factor transporter ATP-binding protein EcfA2